MVACRASCLHPPEDDGLDLDQAAVFRTQPPGDVTKRAELLTSADWLTEATAPFA
jgi:hypothetical protein